MTHFPHNCIEHGRRRDFKIFRKEISNYQQGTRKSAWPILKGRKEISSKKEERKKGGGTLRQIQRGWRVTMLAKDVYIYGGTRREHGCNDALSVTMHRCATLLERGVSRVVTMLLRAATTGQISIEPFFPHPFPRRGTNFLNNWSIMYRFLHDDCSKGIEESWDWVQNEKDK